MDSRTHDSDIVERVLQSVASYPPSTYRTIPSFDRNSGQFVLLREGWDGYKRVHYAWVHIELKEEKFWIHRDGTEHGIAYDLMEQGVPKERIVLAFQHRSRREAGEFAVA